MLLSLIIPVYNTDRELLTYCLDSAVRELFRKDAEVILIDDGSTDESGKICDEFQESYPELFKVFHTKNQGNCAARNLGIRKAIGDRICFLDCDDYLNRGYFENASYAIKHYDRFDAIHFNHFRTALKGSRWRPYIRVENICTVEAACDYENRNNSHMMMWSYLYRRSFLLEHNLFLPEHLTQTVNGKKFYRGEDIYFMVMIFNYATNIKNTIWFGVTHRIREGSLGTVVQGLDIKSTARKDAITELKRRGEYYLGKKKPTEHNPSA